MMRVLVVADRIDHESGFVGERLEQLGATLTTSYREDFPALDAGDAALVLLLGSHHGVADPGREEAVAVESQLVRDCLARGVPVIGICYGAQLAAHALGGVVTKAENPEIGWYYVESHDPSLCPPGPWAHYHYDRFTVPEGTRELGVSDAGPQGFVLESSSGVARLIAWQFHPEVTPDVLQRWVEETADDLVAIGIDGPAIAAEGFQRERVSRAAAHALVDVALDAMSLIPVTRAG
jgi:GMP synthase-like glutamine amidotransferase